MNRLLLRTTTAVAAVTAAALLFPSVANAAAVTSTPTSAQGWGVPFDDEQDEKATYSETSVNDEDGSIEFKTATGAPRQRIYREVANVPLSEVAALPLKFDQSGAALTWQIRLTGAATENAAAGENGFATLVWDSPQGETGVRTVSVPGDSPQWRSTRDLPGLTKNTNTTLADLVSRAGNGAKVTHVGILLYSQTEAIAHVDHVTVNGDTTNFAFASPDDGAFGSLGGLGLASLLP